MNKFCFTQSESNKSYCKTQEQYYIHSFTDFFLIVSISSVNSYNLGNCFLQSPPLQLRMKSMLAFMSVSGSTSNSEDFVSTIFRVSFGDCLKDRQDKKAATYMI